MERYKVILAYDGTNFHGVQRQARERSVQAEVEKALGKLGWKDPSILIAGRTDAGVHASGQVIAFDLEWAHTAEDLQSALNATLPADIAVQGLSQAADDFHPRYDALARRYRYRLFCRPHRDPLRERFTWRVWPLIDLERLREASSHLLGEHDFAAFGTPPKKGGSTIRRVMQAEWSREDDEFIFEVLANAFLYHMVRRMVGLMVKVGKGLAEPESVAQALSADPGLVQELAPPQGLSLVGVDYE